MKVLQINSVCGRGSTGRIALGIGQRVREAGGDSTIAYGRETALGWDDTYRIGSPVEVISHEIKARTLDAAGFGSRRATERFVADMDSRDFDLVQLHNVHGYYLDVEVLFDWLKHQHRPVVWTLHDCWSFTGHCAWFEHVGCYRWRDSCGSCPQRTEYPRSWVIDNSARNRVRKSDAFNGVADLTLVTPSRWLADRVGESFLGDYPRVVLPNEVDTALFSPTPSDFRERHGLTDRYVILAVANGWTDAKGWQHLLGFAEGLRSDESLVVVGTSPAQASRLPAGVVAVPRTSSAVELAEIYSAADVFINPTLDDISSLTNLEAASVGLPVVTFRTGGAPETVEGLASVVLDDRSAAGLRAGVDEARAAGTDNAGVLQARFGGRRAQQAYVELYERILSGGGR